MFISIFFVFFGLLMTRALLVVGSAVPLREPDVRSNIAFCFLAIVAAAVAQRRQHLEVALLLRSAAIAVCAVPFTLSTCALVFHVGRANPFVDAWLASADQALGFDWLTYTRAVDRMPRLWKLLGYAYASILYQLPIICIVLAFTRSARRLYAVLCAQFGSLAIVAGIAVFTPALGTYIFYGSPNIAHSGDFLSPDLVASTIRRLRGGSFSIVLDPVPLITFPSYHACSAVIFAWALWRTPVLKWPCLVINLAMLAATPAFGCHYLVDVVAGVALGLLAACAAHACVSRLDRFLGASHPHGRPRPAAHPEPAPVTTLASV